jgi:hypothetical protein
MTRLSAQRSQRYVRLTHSRSFPKRRAKALRTVAALELNVANALNIARATDTLT